jgi:flagellar motor switch protein FliM
MSDKLLTDEEMDTLLEGVSTGDIEVESESAREEAQPFDFEDQHNLQIRKMPRLEAVHENFIKSLSDSLLKMYSREPVVELSYVHATKFGQYMEKLGAPANLNLIYAMPNRHACLLVLDPSLLYILVDRYFGGSGSLQGKKETTVFSPTEWRMSQQIADMVCKELQKAWHNVAGFSFSHAETVDDPDNIRIYNANEIIVEIAFQVGFEEAVGEMHLVIPYSMLEVVRHSLEADSDQAEEREADHVWQNALTDQISSASLSVCGSIEGIQMKVRDLLALKQGDVMPIPMPDLVCVNVEGLPTFAGTFGRNQEQLALKINASFGEKHKTH